MKFKLNLNLPVCLNDGTPARIVATDRMSETGRTLVALAKTDPGVEQAYYFNEFGKNSVTGRDLLNQFIYDGLQKGMKINPNTGTQPDDFDPTREVVTYDGLTCTNKGGLATFWWPACGGASDVTLYWPKPKTFTLELTAAEIVTLKILTQIVGGHPDTTPRKYLNSINRKLPFGTKYVSGQFDDVTVSFSATTPAFTEVVHALESR